MAGRKQSAGVEMAIGATILVAILLLTMMLLVWGNSSTFLSKHYWVVVLMDNVGGLREGAPVKIGGVQIGKVSSIQLQSGSNELEHECAFPPLIRRGNTPADKDTGCKLPPCAAMRRQHGADHAQGTCRK